MGRFRDLPEASSVDDAVDWLALDQLNDTVKVSPSWFNAGGINAKRFGARCDDSTDDTAAIVAALEAGENPILDGVCRVDEDALAFTDDALPVRGFSRTSPG